MLFCSWYITLDIYFFKQHKYNEIKNTENIGCEIHFMSTSRNTLRNPSKVMYYRTSLFDKILTCKFGKNCPFSQP